MSSATDKSIMSDGNSICKSSRVNDVDAEKSHASKKTKLALLSSGIPKGKEEENRLTSSDRDTFVTEESTPIGRSTVEDRIRARARQHQSAAPPQTTATTNAATIKTSAVADPDILLRIADGIWSHTTTLRKQRTFNGSTKTVSNSSLKLNGNSGTTGKCRTFSLKDIVHVLSTNTMSYVGCTGTVMKSNGDVKSKLSKRQIVEAILQLTTPDRYSNWIVLITSDPLTQSSVRPSAEHGIAEKESKGLLLLQDMSPNTMIQINHSILYTTVRKQILKTFV